MAVGHILDPVEQCAEGLVRCRPSTRHRRGSQPAAGRWQLAVFHGSRPLRARRARRSDRVRCGAGDDAPSTRSPERGGGSSRARGRSAGPRRWRRSDSCSALCQVGTPTQYTMYYCVTRADTNQERNTQAKGDTPHLSEGVPNKITLIRLSQGSLDRWRREKVIWKMITEHSCNPFADLKSESRSKEGRGSQGSPGRLMGQGRGYEGAGALGIKILWVTTQTQLFLNKKKSLAGE